MTTTPTIFHVLREDHDLQRTLMTLLDSTSGDSSQRRELFEKLKHEALMHAAAEERVFYSGLLEDELTRDKAGHSIKEHHEMEAIFEELTTMDMSSTGWLNRFRTLAHDLRHHLEEEEQEIFQLAGKVLSEADKVRLAEVYRAEKTEPSLVS